MEKKYTIELERGETAYKTVNSNGCPMIGLLHPAPYTEPDLEQVRKEAYEEGYAEGSKEDYDEAYLKGYNQGLADAWDTARKIRDMTCTERREVFGTDIYTDIIALPASEAIEKIRQYEQGKEMDGLRQNIQTIVDQCGYTLDEIAEVLEKMKEDAT